MATRYAFRKVKDHPVLGTGVMPEHRLALFDKIGPGPHPCHWCGTSVDWMPGARTRRGALIVDHVDNDGRNNEPDNLVPSCQSCNITRARTFRPLIGVDEFYVLRANGRRYRAIRRTCEQCGDTFGMQPCDQFKANKGRFCSRSCARRAQRRAA